MLNVLATGVLVRDPQERTSATGKTYCTALLRVPCEDADPLLVSAIAFKPDVVRALLVLAAGESVAIAGRAKLSAWEKDGEQKHGLSVVAERVLTPYMLDKARKASRSAEAPAEA